MKIKIREMRGRPACSGFFYAEGKKISQGEVAEVPDDFDFDSEIIEVVEEKPKRGRPRNEDATAE